MPKVSVIICTHRPRPSYFERALDALKAQSYPKQKWELLVVDNANTNRLADTYDLGWHPLAKHVREDNLGLIAARCRGIEESSGELLVFVDDDNVLAPDFLEEAVAIHRQYSYLGVFGAGNLDPEFAIAPSRELLPILGLLSLRNVANACWSNNARDSYCMPWGAGLCVRRALASLYLEFVQEIGKLGVTAVLGRRGTQLFSHDDDVFSWLAASSRDGFGIFPQLRLTHLIAADRLQRGYFLRLIENHAYSGNVFRYLMEGIEPRANDWTRYASTWIHGVRRGVFSMRCQRAELRGEDRAAAFVLQKCFAEVRRFKELPVSVRRVEDYETALSRR